MSKMKEALIGIMDGSNLDDSEYEDWKAAHEPNNQDEEDPWYNQTSEES